MDRNRKTLVGVGYRPQISSWVLSRPPEIQCIEITAEHFFDVDDQFLSTLSADMPSYVHGLGLSLGTPGPLDRETLEQFARVVEFAQPEWISEHVSFTRTDEVDLGHLNPILPSAENVNVVADHAAEVSSRCGRPIVLENITSYLRLDGDLSETEFLNRVCERAECGLLLDVTNLFINSKNHGFDARKWLYEIDLKYIVQLHVVGYTVENGRWHDYHCEPLQEELCDLVRDVVAYAPVRSIILERDGKFPPSEELVVELKKLEACLGADHVYDSNRQTSE